MTTSLKSVIETLNRDANQLERCAQKLESISPDLSLDLASDTELINQKVSSIRKQVESLERWE
jgi:prefoldin subunit 5